MPNEDVYERLRIFNSFIKDRAKGGSLSSALALKKEHMAHVRDALDRGEITGDQHDSLIGELELMGDEEVKKCPRCDATLRGNAKICFKCGFSFEELVTPQDKEPIIPLNIPTPSREGRKPSSRKLIVAGAMLSIFIIFMGLFGALIVKGVIPIPGFGKQVPETIPPMTPQTLMPSTPLPETPQPTAAPPPIAISKIQALSSTPEEEYIEIYNTTSNTQEVTGWTISDNQDNEFKFPKLFLQPGRKVRIYTGSGSNTLVNLYWGMTKFVWDDSGDTITVKDASGNLVIQVTY